MSIEIIGVSKTFNRFKALSNVNFKVETGELVSLLGPSGCGKTTLLRVIAGMEAADPGSGPILFDGHDVTCQEVGKRRIGFVFQSYALFKHMSVFENVAFGLRAKPWRQRPREATCPAAKLRAALSIAALRRPKAKGGARPGARGRAECPIARRTFWRPRRNRPARAAALASQIA
jgi:sulfate transport system ATP-binding protein